MFDYKRHPERMEDEVFIGNRKEGETLSSPCGLRTIRPGKVAYNQDGNVIPGYFPCFALKKELDGKGIRFLEME